MATCGKCNFLAPKEATSCPRCHSPFYAVTQFSPYRGPRDALKAAVPKNKRLLMIAGLSLVVVLGLFMLVGKSEPTVVTRARKEPTDIQQTSAFQPFTPADDAFRIRLPGRPERSEQVVPELGFTRPVVYYTLTYLDMRMAIEQRTVPRYVPPYEHDAALAEWFGLLYPPERFTVESATAVKTPAGDVAFDAVIVEIATGTRRLQRMVTWAGNILTLSAGLPATSPPTPEQTTAWTVMRDSIRQR